MSEVATKRCDDRGNTIYKRYSNGHEYWWEYNENNHIISFKDFRGYKIWKEYDENGNKTHQRDTDGVDQYWEYDGENREIYYKASNGREVWHKYGEESEKTKIGKEEFDAIEYSKRGPITRFELMDLE